MTRGHVKRGVHSSSRQHTSRQCCRALASDTAVLKEAKETAAGAAHIAQSADNAFTAAQEAVQRLSEERAAAEDRLCAAVAHTDECAGGARIGQCRM